MNSFDQTYHAFLSKILRDGEERPDRTGTGVKSLFSHEMTFDLTQGFPLITTKRVHTPSVIHELLWFISGSTNIAYLKDNNVRIWNEWADNHGNLGPVYGKQWRHWETDQGTVDQLQTVIEQIRSNPYSRRHIVSAWNVSDIPNMALPPCHLLFQFYVSATGYLHCKLFQRSADAFLGVPFNIASYSLLTHMVAQQCQLKPGSFVWSGTDCHIYSNHVDAVKTQLSRSSFSPPTLELLKAESMDAYTAEHIRICDYQHHPTIKAPIAV
ncbi:thymidylate synthase [Candidatus Synchoanobacter obligatus]|uniref:Thymidylate synthase n=1 Tax=Candidatus Synchoanobacter obligatus TaxID=2919597 RepID=A0ABT1L583_9GAMM|nr:thymidylate synthase [Candidatus Synchoanobacter obligatus]